MVAMLSESCDKKLSKKLGNVKSFCRYVFLSHLKEHPHPGGQMDDLPAHQAELLAVVEHRVEVLDPGRVDGAVQYNPLPLLCC